MKPDLDVAASHKYFSAHCFNAAWDLIDRADRTGEEDLMMVELSQASIFHWRNRPDCTSKNLSTGYWQASRIQALLGNASEAARFANVCLSYSQGLDPFQLGYAYEALARAASVAGDREGVNRYMDEANAQATQIEDRSSREMLLNDLAALR